MGPGYEGPPTDGISSMASIASTATGSPGSEALDSNNILQSVDIPGSVEGATAAFCPSADLLAQPKNLFSYSVHAS